jgi:hypothetical protein
MNIEEAYPDEEYSNEDNETQMIKIHGENECAICGGEFNYTKTRFRDWNMPEGLYEVRFRVEHPSCRYLMNKLLKARNEMLDLEFELFCKKFNSCKYKRCIK